MSALGHSLYVRVRTGLATALLMTLTFIDIMVTTTPSQRMVRYTWGVIIIIYNVRKSEQCTQVY